MTKFTQYEICKMYIVEEVFKTYKCKVYLDLIILFTLGIVETSFIKSIFFFDHMTVSCLMKIYENQTNK